LKSIFITVTIWLVLDIWSWTIGYWGSWSTCQSSLSLILSLSTCQIDSVLFYLAGISRV